MSIQTDIDSLIGGVSVFNLALNVAGIINNKKNVAIYVKNKETKREENILEGNLGRFSGITGFASMIDDSGIVMSAEIVENSKLAEHPLENGEILADNKIELPTEINIQITLQAQDYKDRLSQIRDYKNNNVMLSVKTKFGRYDNMQIISMPCNLNVDNINRVSFTLKLRQVIVAEDLEKMSADTVADKSNANTENIGYKTGTTTEIETSFFRSA